MINEKLTSERMITAFMFTKISDREKLLNAQFFNTLPILKLNEIIHKCVM